MKHVAKIPFACFSLFAGVYVARLLWITPHLSEPVAVHFNLSGEADRWSSREEFLTVSTIVSVLVLGLFTGLALFASRVPDDVTNLPRKDYWLAPERRAATHRKMSTLFSWLGCVAVILLGVVNEGVYRTNVTGSAEAVATGLRIVLALTAVLVLVTMLACRHFYRVPKTAETIL